MLYKTNHQKLLLHGFYQFDFQAFFTKLSICDLYLGRYLVIPGSHNSCNENGKNKLAFKISKSLQADNCHWTHHKHHRILTLSTIWLTSTSGRFSASWTRRTFRRSSGSVSSAALGTRHCTSTTKTMCTPLDLTVTAVWG